MSQYAPMSQQQQQQQQQLLWLSQQQQQMQQLLAQQQQQHQPTQHVAVPGTHHSPVIPSGSFLPQQVSPHTLSSTQEIQGGGTHMSHLAVPGSSLQQTGSVQAGPSTLAGSQAPHLAQQGATPHASQQHQQQVSIPGLPAGAVIVPPSQPGASPLVQLPNGMRCVIPPEALAALQARTSPPQIAVPPLQLGHTQATPTHPQLAVPAHSPRHALPSQASQPSAVSPRLGIVVPDAAPRQVTTGLGLPNHSPREAAALLMSGGKPDSMAAVQQQQQPQGVQQPLQQQQMMMTTIQAPSSNGMHGAVSPAAALQHHGSAMASGAPQQQGSSLKQQQLQQLQQALLQKLQTQPHQPQQTLQQLQQQQQVLQLLQAVGNTPAGLSQLLPLLASKGIMLPPGLQALLLQQAQTQQSASQAGMHTALGQRSSQNGAAAQQGALPGGSLQQAAAKPQLPGGPSPQQATAAGRLPAQTVDPTSRAAALEKEAMQFMLQQRQDAERQLMMLMQAQMQQPQPQQAVKAQEQEQQRQEQLLQERKRKEQQKLEEKRRKEEEARKAKEQAEVDKQRRLIAHQQALLAQQQRIIEQQQQLLRQQQQPTSPTGQQVQPQPQHQATPQQLPVKAKEQHDEGDEEDEGEDEDDDEDFQVGGFESPGMLGVQPQPHTQLLVRQLSQQQQGEVVLSDAERAEKERRLAMLLEKVDRQRMQQQAVLKPVAGHLSITSSSGQAGNLDQVQAGFAGPSNGVPQASSGMFAPAHTSHVQGWREEEDDDDEEDEFTPPKSRRKPIMPPITGVKFTGGRDPHSWTVIERDTLRRELMLFGLGRPGVLHQAMTAHLKNYQKSEAETMDGVWHFLQALEDFVLVPDDKTFLQQLLEPVTDRGKIITPGQPWNRLNGTMVRRLRVLEDIRKAMALLQQPTVYGAWLAALTAMSDQHPPAPWWNVKCDVALLYGCWKHGYANYDAMKKDPEYFSLFYDNATAKAAAAAVTAAGDGPAPTLPPTSAGAANAETLTKRFRRLLDMVPRAQKAAAAAAEKAAKEAERSAREAERAARAAAEKARREAAEQAAWAEKLEQHAARARAKKAQQGITGIARRMAEEVLGRGDAVSEQSAEGAAGTTGTASSIPAPGTKRIKKPRRLSLDGTPDIPFSPSPKKPRATSQRAAAGKAITGKNPDELSATKLNDLIKFLMAWGLPTQLDWAEHAAQHAPSNIPTPKALAGKASGSKAATTPVPTAEAAAAAQPDGTGNMQVDVTTADGVAAPHQVAATAAVALTTEGPEGASVAADAVKQAQGGTGTNVLATEQPHGDYDAADGAAVVHTAPAEGQQQGTGVDSTAVQVKAEPGLAPTALASGQGQMEGAQAEAMAVTPDGKNAPAPTEQMPGNMSAAPVQGDALTAPVTDRAQAVAACLAGLQASLALPQRVADASSGLSLVKVWSGLTQVEQVWEAVRKACPALATRSDLCLRQAVLDILADLQDVEAGATKKRGGAGGGATGNKSQKQHAPNCPCAVCTRIRRKTEKEAAAANEANGAKDGAPDQAATDAADVSAKPEASAQHTDQGTATAAADVDADAGVQPAEQLTSPVKTEPGAEAEPAAEDAGKAGEGDEDGEGEGMDEEEDGNGDQEGGQEGGGAAELARDGTGAAGDKPQEENKAPPTLRLLTPSQAARLRERLVLLLSLHAGHELLKPQWQEQPALVNRMGDLPVWWHPKHDGELVAAILQHGMGEWTAVLEDPSASFSSSQEEFINRQLARRALARDIKAGKTPAEGTETLTEEEVETLASVAEDAPVVGAGLPGPAALLKRCRQTSVVVLRLLRKEKYLKDDLRKKRKRADAGAEGGGGGKKERVDTAAAALHAQAMAIALEALQAGDAAAAAQAATGVASPDEKPQPKSGGGRRGPKPKARGDQDELPTDPALRAEALRIALEVMAHAGAEQPAPQAAAAAAPAGSVAAGAGGMAAPAVSTDQTATATATETVDAAGAAGGKLLTDAQSPLMKKPAGKAATQRKRKGAVAAAVADGEEGDVPVKAKKAKGGAKGAGKAGGISELALQIAREAAAAAAGGKGGAASTSAAAADAPAPTAAAAGETRQVADDTQTEATEGTVGASCAPRANGTAAAAGEVSSPKPPAGNSRGRGRGGGGRGRGRAGDAKAAAAFKPPRRTGTGKRGAAAAKGAEGSQGAKGKGANSKEAATGSKATGDDTDTKTSGGGAAPGFDEEEVRKVFGTGPHEEEVGDYALMLHDLEQDTNMADQLLGELGNADTLPDGLLDDLM